MTKQVSTMFPGSGVLLLLLVCDAGQPVAPAQQAATQTANCDRTSVGFTPLTDLGTDSYKGEQGGLYRNGQNAPPAAHLEAGLRVAQSVAPLNRQGQSDVENGRIVLLSIGMSNTTQEFQVFKRIADADAEKNPRLIIVDGAQGAQSADRIATPDAPFWQVVEDRLTAAGVSASQVQAAWIKQATPGPKRPFPEEPRALQGYLRTILQIMHQRYPNLRLAYCSSRIYAGYATTALNPEPHAYETAFAVKWLIQEQLNGDATLNHDPVRGEVRVPWVAWGPYLWADGLTPRSDGLIWECADLRQNDGTHPSPSGQGKVANLLLRFFKTDATAKVWFARP